MKFLMMIKHKEHTEGFMPPQSLMDAMGEFVTEGFSKGWLKDTAGLKPTRDGIRIRQKNGKLSVTQGVMATGKTFEEVEHALDEMVRSGYVDVTNDENTGIVVYNFGQLQADS